MLYARVVRPPYAGVDSGAPIGQSLVSVDEASIKDIRHRASCVTGTIGIVAEREECHQGGRQVILKPWAGLPDLSKPESALRAISQTAP
jgi:hypothetical protein